MRALLYNKVYQKLEAQMLLQISSIAYHQECYLSIDEIAEFFPATQGQTARTHPSRWASQ